MALYDVTWNMPIEAASPFEAARKALAIHRDPESIASVFVVHRLDEKSPEWTIDALSLDGVQLVARRENVS